jgi:transcriptional regulator with XRE-family HTH domain
MGPVLSAFGDLLRQWRGAQGLSQLELSQAAGVSSRHISFIETGRSRPSRSMVMRLAGTLGLPLRERNALLVGAGFAPIYPERRLDEHDLAPVRRALELVLRSHEPYPAFVLDAGWNILVANDAHHRLLRRLLPEGAPLSDPVNVVRLVLDPALLRPRIGNWPVVAHVLAHRLRRQLRAPSVAAGRRRQLELLLSLPGVEEALDRTAPPPESSVVIPLELLVGDRRLSFFSTVATLGTPQDVTLDELMIESLFPADEMTALVVRELGSD